MVRRDYLKNILTVAEGAKSWKVSVEDIVRTRIQKYACIEEAVQQEDIDIFDRAIQEIKETMSKGEQEELDRESIRYKNIVLDRIALKIKERQGKFKRQKSPRRKSKNL